MVHLLFYFVYLLDRCLGFLGGHVVYKNLYLLYLKTSIYYMRSMPCTDSCYELFILSIVYSPIGYIFFFMRFKCTILTSDLGPWDINGGHKYKTF